MYSSVYTHFKLSSLSDLYNMHDTRPTAMTCMCYSTVHSIPSRSIKHRQAFSKFSASCTIIPAYAMQYAIIIRVSYNININNKAPHTRKSSSPTSCSAHIHPPYSTHRQCHPYHGTAHRTSTSRPDPDIINSHTLSPNRRTRRGRPSVDRIRITPTHRHIQQHKMPMMHNRTPRCSAGLTLTHT